MDLNELLSYKPNKRTGEKRPLEEGNEEHAPSKRPRPKLGGDRIISKAPPVSGEKALPNLLLPTLPQVGTGGNLNGISDEEKLKLLQSMDDDEDESGELAGTPLQFSIDIVSQFLC